MLGGYVCSTSMEETWEKEGRIWNNNNHTNLY